MYTFFTENDTSCTNAKPHFIDIAFLAWWFNATVRGYWTTPNGRGRNKHTDWYDIVIVHLYGRKHWIMDGECFFLDPGDTYYMPAETEHECWAGDKGSFHLTFGLQNTRTGYANPTSKRQ